MDKLIVIDPGLQTTVQDLGRFDYQIDGFPTSGCMDTFSSKLANLLVGNEDDDALLEFCLLGGTFQFKANTFIAFTGGRFELSLNDEPINSYQAVQVRVGDTLKIGHSDSGRYGYLAIAGGILEPLVMNSRSTTTRIEIGGHKGRSLNAGDSIPIKSTYTLDSFAFRKLEPQLWPKVDEPLMLRIIKGPQWDMFSDTNAQKFLSQSYQVSANSDRMGYRMSGDAIPTGKANMLSEATVMGGIQISSDGKPIVLLADRQTTGGYPVIGVVISADIYKFVQSSTNQVVQFKLVTLEDAYKELAEERSEFLKLKENLTNKRFEEPIGINRSATQRINTLFE